MSFTIDPVPFSSAMMAYDPYDAARQSQKLAARKLKRRRTRLAARPHGPAQPLCLSTGSDTQRRGYAAEQQARVFLQAQGLTILATNLRCRAGEIDLVAQAGGTLVFIEVRQRSHPGFGGAAASVNRAKQARLIRAASCFLRPIARHFFGDRTPACRFDVITLEADEVAWIRDAFR